MCIVYEPYRVPSRPSVSDLRKPQLEIITHSHHALMPAGMQQEDFGSWVEQSFSEEEEQELEY